MGLISIDTMRWRNNSNLSALEIDVGALFRAGALFTARGFSHSTQSACCWQTRPNSHPSPDLTREPWRRLRVTALDSLALREN
jgi:hypothetical protein